jgi:2-polyprenyl-3-methyl-5-hydroxy-6-metoxy-1,4-benzoquinol methylase
MQTSSWNLDRSRLEPVACPLCQSVKFERLAATDRYNMGLVTVGCLGCGLVMTNPQPTAEALDDFYAHHYRHFYSDFGPRDGIPTEAHIRAYRIDRRCAVTADLLVARGELLPGMVVLDIGAAEGSMLKAMRDQAADTRRIAIEPNPVFGRFAMAHAGCEWHASLADLRASVPPPIDLVIINHVLEHLKHPVQVLESLKPLLAPNARVYIEVPDVLEYRKLTVLHIAHLYHFSADTLAHLAGNAGFDVRLIEAYAPAKHPRSLRCVLAASTDAAVTVESHAVVNRRAGWGFITACARHAWFAHGKRWLRSAAARSRSAGA